MKRVAAAFILFTRLPLWRWVSPSQEAYSDAVVFWPLVGWLTGGVTALCLLLFSWAIPWLPAVVLSMVIRLLLTGALHEDGLADFCDAFGCGGDKARILSIMKDSHIGTYGVLGLIFYALMMVSLLASLPPYVAAYTVFAADPFSKFCAGQLTNFLDYARPEGAKNRISYSRMDWSRLLVQALFGLLPLGVLCSVSPELCIAGVLPVATLLFLSWMMRREIGGYTGDCCGATFLLCELSMVLGICILLPLI